MCSILRVSTSAAVAVKLSPPPYQISPYSLRAKRPPFSAAVADTRNAPAGQGTPPKLPLVSICQLTGVDPPKADPQQLPFLASTFPVCDAGDTKSNDATDPETPPESPIVHSTFATAPSSSSSFPVFGPFDLLCCLQNGGFGSAWAARDQHTGHLLCLKVFHPLQDPDIARSVQMELKMFRRMVKSKGGERGRQFVMELSRSIQHSTTVLFAMELMTGDLGTYLSTDPGWCKMHARRWMAQIALGIQSLHEMGILHRDIKVENVLIDCRANVRIIDFGLSYLEPTGKPLVRGRDYAIEFLGTPPYMAPELLRNKGMPVHRRRHYGPAADWWGLGCILYELESPDHMLLFDTEEDVHKYVAWTQRVSQLEQEVFPKFEVFDPVALNLLEGLLQVQPSVRFSLNDLEKHEYFSLSDGPSEFDNAAARAQERPVIPELVPVFTGDGPTQVIEAAKPSSIFDWMNLNWAL